MKRIAYVIFSLFFIAPIYAKGECKDFVLHNQDGIEYKLYQPCVRRNDTLGYRCTLSRIDTLYFIRKKVKKLIVPESIVVDSITYPVTDCQGTSSINCFESVVLPRYVRDANFLNCHQIKKIDMSLCDIKNLPELGSCKSLKTLVLPDRFWSLICNHISGCKNLEKIVLSDCSIAFTFTGCENLRKIYIPKGVRSIQTAGIWYVRNELPMGDVRFRKIKVDKKNPNYCSVRNVLYNKDKTKLVLYPARKRRRVFRVPKSVKEIGMYAFHNATDLKRVILSDSVRHIGRGAFEGCTSLDSIQFPAGLLYIDRESMPAVLKDLYFRGNISFNNNNPSSMLHLPDGHAVSSKDYFNTKPDRPDTELLTCDSIVQSIKSVMNIPYEIGDYGWGVGGDRNVWRIIKYGKKAVPCLISLTEDSTLVTAVYEKWDPIEKVEYEVSVAKIALSLICKIIPELYNSMESDGVLEWLKTGHLSEVHDYVATWYDSYKDHLIWVHSLEPQWRIDNKYVVIPSEGHYERIDVEEINKDH